MPTESHWCHFLKHWRWRPTKQVSVAFVNAPRSLPTLLAEHAISLGGCLALLLSTGTIKCWPCCLSGGRSSEASAERRRLTPLAVVRSPAVFSEQLLCQLSHETWVSDPRGSWMLAEGYQASTLATSLRRSLVFFFFPVVHLLCHDPYHVPCLFHAVQRGSGADPPSSASLSELESLSGDKSGANSTSLTVSAGSSSPESMPRPKAYIQAWENGRLSLQTNALSHDRSEQ